VLNEFDRQLHNLIQKGYPEAAGMPLAHFLKYMEPLRERINEYALPEADLENGRLPFVIVIQSVLVAAEKMMALVGREGETGFISMYPVKPDNFKPIDSVHIPNSLAYLLLDIDRGKDTINIAPIEALAGC